VACLAQYAEDLAPACDSRELYADKSLFKAQGPVWHQSDRRVGRIPPACILSTPMPLGAKVHIMAGSMAMGCL
jgi:hypothetical protein